MPLAVNHSWSRLFVDAALSAGVTVELTESQAHYVGTVMRRRAGDMVRLFNGRDGEWLGRLGRIHRARGVLAIETLLAPQTADADLWLVFAVLKRDQTDLVVQKATELGVSGLVPVFTQHTNAARVNEDRLRAIAVEAAEQSERLTVPVLHPPAPLEKVLAGWATDRTLFAALERSDAPVLRPFIGPAGLLVGPEGGFSPREQAALAGYAFVRPVSLGRRILRAETASIAGLVLLQAPA